MECEAGTVVLIHYDIWHRGTPNVGGCNRYVGRSHQLVELITS